MLTLLAIEIKISVVPFLFFRQKKKKRNKDDLFKKTLDLNIQQIKEMFSNSEIELL